MGTGYVMKCPRCDYEVTGYLGIGFMYPQVYEETKKKMLQGKFGKEWKEFFEEYPLGAVNASSVWAVCEDCGEIGLVKDMSLYTNKSEDMKEAVWFSGNDSNYKLYKKFQHKCGSCKGKMHITKTDELKCPKCKVKLEEAEIIMWD